jgi:sensor histidine kinase regulating citrate/malate metabolism
MSEITIMTPDQARRKKLAAQEQATNMARALLNEVIKRSGGERFQLAASFIDSDAMQKLTAELHNAGWSIRRVPDQRDGDYYDIRPVR